MPDALRFVGGDEVVEPFLLTKTDGSVLDLTTVAPITGGVWWRGRRRIALAIGSGITIINDAPALVAEDQEPHGNITLSEAQTILIPFGLIASLRLVAVTALGDETLSTYHAPLERIT